MPEDIPEEVPDEVKLVLAHLKPEPEFLAGVRTRLLDQLDTLAASSQGTLQQLLERMRVALQATRPGAAFQPLLAREFTAALEAYQKDTSASKPPPSLLVDCLVFLREHMKATGMGPLLEAVDEVSPQSSPPEKDVQQQQELQTRIKLSHTRG